MAEATKQCFCDSCHTEVTAARNPHRVRNTTAASFAAANLAMISTDFSGFGATGPYVCPHCRGEVKAGGRSKQR
jgi:hypothetical protein